jgi:predicted enzyme related to lactoylglutathione lyase
MSLHLSYVELTVDDMAAAQAFYSSAFGWEFNDYGPDYAGVRAPEGDDEVGGLAAGPRPSPGGPLCLFRSTDLEATDAAVRTAGGTVVAEIYDYPGGRRFEFTDPAGNRLGVFQPTE